MKKCLDCDNKVRKENHTRCAVCFNRWLIKKYNIPFGRKGLQHNLRYVELKRHNF